jgi:hypothetical protein
VHSGLEKNNTGNKVKNNTYKYLVMGNSRCSVAKFFKLSEPMISFKGAHFLKDIILESMQNRGRQSEPMLSSIYEVTETGVFRLVFR